GGQEGGQEEGEGCEDGGRPVPPAHVASHCAASTWTTRLGARVSPASPRTCPRNGEPAPRFGGRFDEGAGVVGRGRRMGGCVCSPSRRCRARIAGRARRRGGGGRDPHRQRGDAP